MEFDDEEQRLLNTIIKDHKPIVPPLLLGCGVAFATDQYLSKLPAGKFPIPSKLAQGAKCKFLDPL
jgi:hypothetical protein